MSTGAAAVAPISAQYPPTHLRIPSIAIDASIDEVRNNPSGELYPPEDVDRVGWWSPGARPTGPGSTVLLAHVDSQVQGRGVFFDLRSTATGADVVVDTASGPVHYVVTSVEEYDKKELPVELFSIVGDRRLVLITCGGDFDRESGNYDDNIVVTATPA
ncbi:class F sortase [Rhodococcus sp. IEGM 1318]|uniref:class F sortase n=1 Tax=Rhodococcus sp. IEGM 1318 TaxID=3082226 RepID=UPI002953E7AD|nr:class F sortase [Rhodococcus sp. IEGM 1318]MDV8009252.1 class F sortase [Rhodococcus sp. IEGM 1318]